MIIAWMIITTTMITVIMGMACFDHSQPTALSTMHHSLPSCARLARSPPQTGSIIGAVKPIADRLITAAPIAPNAPRSMATLVRVVARFAVWSSGDGNNVCEHERSIETAVDRADDRALDCARGTPTALTQAPRGAASERDSTATASLLPRTTIWTTRTDSERPIRSDRKCSVRMLARCVVSLMQERDRDGWLGADVIVWNVASRWSPCSTHGVSPKQRKTTRTLLGERAARCPRQSVLWCGR